MKKGLFFILQFAFVAFAQAQFPNFSAGHEAEIKNLNSLHNELRRGKKDTAHIGVLNSLARVHYHLNNNDSLGHYAKKAMEASRNIAFVKGLITARAWLVEWLLRIGDHPTAIQIGLQNLKEAEQTKNTLSIIYANRSLALAYLFARNPAMIIRYTGRNMQLVHSGYFRNERDVKFYSLIGYSALRGLGFNGQNQLDSALYYRKHAYQSALYLNNDDALALTTHNLANFYKAINQYDSASWYFRKSIAYTREAGVRIDRIAAAYLGMAEMFQPQQPDSALYYARLSLQSVAGIYPRFELSAASFLNRLYAKQNRIDSAYKYLSIASTLKDSLYGEEKVKQVQTFGFNEQLRQQQAEQVRKEEKQRYETRTKMYSLIAGLVVLLAVAFLLYRNNRQKHKANLLLQQKNAEIGTQREKVEAALAELKATQAQLVQQEKMASLGELTAGIAHEIQNPLNFINNFSEVSVEILDEAKEEFSAGNQLKAFEAINETKENLKKVVHHGKRADAIVKGMLQHSRASTDEKQPIDINALADNYLRLSYHGMRAKEKAFNATIETNFDQSLQHISVAPQEIGQVLLNLYNNAFYAVSEKKNRLNGTYEPVVSVSTSRQQDKVEICIKDNGTGIPQPVQDKIFQPFFTTKPAGQGTGLGLSLSYDIITKGHGGEMKVETKEDEGAVFIIRLPAL